MPQSHDDADINSSKPDITREAVEHTPYKRLLARQARHLSIGRVTEIGKHQQQNPTEVMRHIGKMKHPACTNAQEDREDGNHIGVDTQAIPKQGKHQTDGTGEMDIQPLLRILRLKRQLQQLLECSHNPIIYINPAIASAASSRQREKLGQSLKSIIYQAASAHTIQSPP